MQLHVADVLYIYMKSTWLRSRRYPARFSRDLTLVSETVPLKSKIKLLYIYRSYLTYISYKMMKRLFHQLPYLGSSISHFKYVWIHWVSSRCLIWPGSRLAIFGFLAGRFSRLDSDFVEIHTGSRLNLGGHLDLRRFDLGGPREVVNHLPK